MGRGFTNLIANGRIYWTSCNVYLKAIAMGEINQVQTVTTGASFKTIWQIWQI